MQLMLLTLKEIKSESSVENGAKRPASVKPIIQLMSAGMAYGNCV